MLRPDFQRFNSPAKVLRTPSKILANFIHFFSRLTKNEYDSTRYPFLYHFFSYRDFTFWVVLNRKDLYEIRAVYPDGFNVDKYAVNHYFNDVHPDFRPLFRYPTLERVSLEFSYLCEEAIKYVSFNSSYSFNFIV